jgi:hypothetical protein
MGYGLMTDGEFLYKNRNLLFFRKVSLLKGLHCQLKDLCLDEYFALFCCDNSYQHRDCINGLWAYDGW